MSSPHQERRRHPRVGAPELPIQIQGTGDEALRVRDLSLSGVAFYSEHPVPVMTRVRFGIEIPGGSPNAPYTLEGEGIVVRCERLASALGHYEVAVFFSDLGKEASAAIQAYVDRRLRAQDQG